MVETPDDLAGFFDAEEHAVTLTVRPGEADAADIRGIYEWSHAAGGNAMANVSMTAPELMVPDSAVSAEAIEQGTAMQIKDTVYRVADLQPDGTGVTRLILDLDA